MRHVPACKEPGCDTPSAQDVQVRVSRVSAQLDQKLFEPRCRTLQNLDENVVAQGQRPCDPVLGIAAHSDFEDLLKVGRPAIGLGRSAPIDQSFKSKTPPAGQKSRQRSHASVEGSPR